MLIHQNALMLQIFGTVFRAVLMYFTFCRYSDYKDLTDQDITDHGDHLEIIFKKSKNDQFYKGTNSILTTTEGSSLCPVQLTRLYFKTFKLNFKTTGLKQQFLNFYLLKKGQSHTPLTSKSIVQSNATKHTKNLLKTYNVPNNLIAKFTEKSLKIAGVTALLDSGEPLENVSIAGRWKTTHTPQHYRNTSTFFRKKIASNIPHTSNSHL